MKKRKTEQIMLTIPREWKLRSQAKKQGYANVQDYIKELIRQSPSRTI